MAARAAPGGAVVESGSPDAQIAHWISEFGADPVALLHVLNALVPTPHDALRQITIPAFVAIGDKDERSDADKLAALLHNARFVRVPGDHGSAFAARAHHRDRRVPRRTLMRGASGPPGIQQCASGGAEPWASRWGRRRCPEGSAPDPARCRPRACCGRAPFSRCSGRSTCQQKIVYVLCPGASSCCGWLSCLLLAGWAVGPHLAFPQSTPC